jgi:hypothetical protein
MIKMERRTGSRKSTFKHLQFAGLQSEAEQILVSVRAGVDRKVYTDRRADGNAPPGAQGSGSGTMDAWNFQRFQ